MKLAISLLLSVLSLTYSTISMAESTVSSADKDKALLEACLKDPLYRIYGYYFVPNEQQRYPHHFQQEKKTHNLEGYQVFDFIRTAKTTSTISNPDLLKRDIEATNRIAGCFRNKLFTSALGPVEKLSKEQFEIKNKEARELADSYEVSENNILNKAHKIQFNFTTDLIKEKSRAEICADYKDRKNDDYAFCMGTKVHQGPTCQNSAGDACGTQYDKSRAGSTKADDKHYVP